VLADKVELVGWVLWQLATGEHSGDVRAVAQRLLNDSEWKGNVVGSYIVRTRVKPDADREALYGAMLDLGHELPSLLEPRR